MHLMWKLSIQIVDTVDTKIKTSNAFNVMFVNTVDTRFIRYSKCSTQICIDSVDNLNAEFSH